MSFEAKFSAFSTIRLRQRELGFPDKIGAGDALAKSLYCAMEPCNQWDPFEDCGSQLQGGVFNLEFSPEGSLLVAACEKKSVLIFDPLTYKKIHSVNDAHSDCVNCVKFLDGRMFATCSDDTTIALWDIRNLKKRIRTLYGHSNWVKNIEYSVKDNLLVTSGLDGSIYTWDINSYTEWSLVYQRVFHASGLMRCRISPDASQMVMCTTGGLLIIVHNLNLSTLAQDLHGFKPNMYRLMQMSLQHIPIASSYDHLFERSRKENRVEFISDFPEGNDAEVVSSLQIHPQGWCALSRNISHDNRSEWTCIHDIQADDDKDDIPIKEEITSASSRTVPPRAYTMRRYSRRIGGRAVTPRSDTSDSGIEIDPLSDMAGTSREASSVPRQSSNVRTFPPSSGIHNDVWEASITIKQHRVLLDMASRGETGQSFNMQRIMGINTGISPPDVDEQQSSADNATGLSQSPNACPPVSVNERVRPSTSGSTSRTLRMENDEDSDPDPEPKKPSRSQIRQNKERLLYYSQEPNLGKGFIKELCFSSDGRLVCSPYGYGMRLLALSDDCSELSHCYPERGEPRLLTELGQCIRHEDLVVSSKFSPRHHLLVTGCLAGRIVWYQPLG